MPGSTIRLFGVMISVGTPKNTSGEAADNTVDNGSTSTEHNKEKQVRDLEGHGSPRKKARNEQDSNLRCPRCNSHETRFCYYNNKNEGQPRYLCKNCMRFWTAGGRQRNIPVGAAKRKTKSSTSPQRHNLFIPQGLQSCCLDVLNLDRTSSASSSSFSSHRPVLMGEGYICSSPAMAAISTAIRMEGPSSGPPAPLLPHLQRSHGVLCAGLWSPIRYTAITSFAVRDETDNSGLAPSDEDLSRINFL